MEQTEHERRMERIAVIRGILQIVGIMVLIAGTYALWSVRHMGAECAWENPNGTLEKTGLYGNCTWIKTRLVLGTKGGGLWNNNTLPLPMRP